MAAALLDLEFEFVRRQERNLHPREKSRQQQHYDDQDDGGEHRFQFLSLGSTETCSSRRTGRASSREPSRIFSGRRSTSASGLPTCLSAGPAGISRAGAAAGHFLLPRNKKAYPDGRGPKAARMACKTACGRFCAGRWGMPYGRRPLPPCSVIVSPVTYAASSDARNTHTRPTSFSGSAKRPSGMPWMV